MKPAVTSRNLTDRQITALGNRLGKEVRTAASYQDGWAFVTLHTGERLMVHIKTGAVIEPLFIIDEQA